MRDKELYAAILGIRSPWQVQSVQLDLKGEEVHVLIEAEPGTRFTCPQCGKVCPGYDARRRSWRHLDTCQFKTVLECDVPRVECPEHSILQINVPWAEPNSGFTALMEALVIDWLKEASIKAVSMRMGLTWDEADGILQRAVRRGLKRRKVEDVRRIGVDETSFKKGHEYVTIVSNQQGGGVLHVADGRGQAALDEFWPSLTREQLAALEGVAMDMSAAFVASTRKHVPGAESKIAFDRFHVAGAINKGVNEVRKQEHRELTAQGDPTLNRTKYIWLKNPENHTELQEAMFELLKDLGLKVARAWAMKETARGLWSYATRGWARRAWTKWISWATRSRLEPMRRVARTVKAHLWGILNAIVLGVTNAGAESLNAKVQWIKNNACGFRNRERFKNAIYFHCGNLDLYPDRLPATHTKA
ncbi:MAG: ISL3 family transposase [Planctomycetota bacterium]